MAPRGCQQWGAFHSPRHNVRVAFLLLVASLACLLPLSQGEDWSGDDRIVEEYDSRLQATVYCRSSLAGGAWRPQRSAGGFHISKFLGGVELSEDMARAVQTGALNADEIQTRAPLRFVLNYAGTCCREAQEANCRTALQK